MCPWISRHNYTVPVKYVGVPKGLFNILQPQNHFSGTEFDGSKNRPTLPRESKVCKTVDMNHIHLAYPFKFPDMTSANTKHSRALHNCRNRKEPFARNHGIQADDSALMFRVM
ncbi:unnamed protein product [Cercopithifilaria johnstoni]|uniref:Uncharacterized protein n=1 Tax=Cercopithifilaria johnstoni TaxID=2874296 RepID=A0A8J2MRX1_9BILA|nr:unnamed protein product [Cercopithifilaria johnstoni]